MRTFEFRSFSSSQLTVVNNFLRTSGIKSFIHFPLQLWSIRGYHYTNAVT